ncbi:MAG: hypothetical protein J6B92_00175 [Paraprevotella sp.]|nr:hypothetical protein [Paraprevotella sp.]
MYDTCNSAQGIGQGVFRLGQHHERPSAGSPTGTLRSVVLTRQFGEYSV